MKFEDALTRLGDDGLQEILGNDVVKLMNSLDPTFASITGYLQIIKQIKSPVELLRNLEIRNKIFYGLRLESAVTLAGQLNLRDGNEPFSQLVNSVIPKNSDNESTLFNFFEIDIPITILREEIEIEEDIIPLRIPFQHQLDAIREIDTNFASDEMRMVLHMPTGSGKTRTAMDVICRQLIAHPGKLIIWLAYSEELCQQAFDEFRDAWGTIGDRPLSAYRYWGNSDLELESLREGFVVAGFAKMHNARLKNPFVLATLADRTELVVIDEAHQAIAQTYRDVLELLCKNPTSKLLGLTATPGRTWDDPEKDKELSEFFNRTKVTLKVPGYENPVDYLVEEGYLARPMFEPLKVDSPKGLTEKDRLEIATALEVPAYVLEKLAKDDIRNLRIMLKLEELAKRHKRIIFFAATVEHSDLIAALLLARGFEAMSVTGKTPGFERQSQITRYLGNSEQTIFLCNFGVFTTGFDAPRTSAAVIARPTKSLVLFSQMAGRALRGTKQGGNAIAEIVSVVDTNLPGFGNIAEAFTNWEDVW
jgi:superfamily II DNA or RNA helicase